MINLELQEQKINKPWGYYHILDLQEGFQVKKIFVNPKAKLSLQSHKHRSEHWVVVKGKARVTKNNKIYHLKKNESMDIPKGAKHRIENTGNDKLIFIEVQTGTYFGEDDIIRIEDDYNRIK